MAITLKESLRGLSARRSMSRWRDAYAAEGVEVRFVSQGADPHLPPLP